MSALTAAESGAGFDVLLRHGVIFDGGGQAPFAGDVAIKGDTIAAIFPSGQTPATARATTELELRGLAVAPGFINMLSWADEPLLHDGHSQSDIRQGVTLEVFGEGWSMGPLNDGMKRELAARQGDLKYEVAWTTLGEFLEYLVRRGVAPNVASFVGATTVRIHELGYVNRPPTTAELRRMCELVREAMAQGALGLGSALIYAPACYARTDELVALARAAGESGGLYISHLRSEGNRLLEGVDELLEIMRQAGVAGEVYHFKAAGKANWPKFDLAIRKLEAARAAGARVTADMYVYPAAATGLAAAMPPWVQEGGYDAWARRLQDPGIRARVRREMLAPSGQWESLYQAAGSPDKVLLIGFKNEKLKPLTGKTLAQVAALRGVSAEETAMDLVVEDGTRVGVVYFVMSEENVRKAVELPWVSFGSDEGSLAPEGAFLKSNPHPRAYGNFARVLGKYAREEKLLSLAEAVRRLSALPASNLKLERRGGLRPGDYADVVVFDPGRVADHATFEQPHQFATGVRHVFVNGVAVLRDGEHTGATPGRVLRGPGWKSGAGVN